MSTRTIHVGVDLGKTGCRALLQHAGEGGGRTEADGPGAPGLADPGGVDRAEEAVRQVVGRLLADGGTATGLVVGAAGAEAAPEQARELAARLTRSLPVRSVAVTSDSVTAHAGALGGRPGTVLAVGTGSVALAVDAQGHRRQVDGWGPWLGDDGSGAWIGREALRAVLAAREGRAPETALTPVAVSRFGDLAVLPRRIHQSGSTASTTASFTPDVVAAADAGDDVARAVLDRAVGHWVELTVAAAGSAGEALVALVGGLADVAALRDGFAEQLPGHLVLQAAAGSPVDGALLLAISDDLPHEAFVVRLGTSGTADGTVPDDVDALATEQVRADLHDLDSRSPAEVVGVLLDAEATVPAALAAARPALTEAVRLAGEALNRGGRLLYVGAGTPGRLAALDAAECPPTFGTPPERVVAVLAGGREADRVAVEGAEDDAGAGEKDLLALAPTPEDLVVGITASGRTPYVLSALEAARRAGARTVAVVNNPGSVVAAAADVAVVLDTGPEVLSGSTRLKSGTAQKITLNVLSTGAMVAHGKTYGAWMVDVVASNEKLRRRARRILREATGVDDEAAVAALEEAGWRTKPALVALLAGVDVPTATAALVGHEDRVRPALEALGSRRGSR
jgi:N-acetylmuramic acid 6-phosphate etherase